MSEKIGLARAEIVDLLSLILRTHSRDELFSLFRSAEGITPKEDPEAWREENLKKQAAGVKFEKLHYPSGKWFSSSSGGFIFTGNKEDYREAPQEVQKEGDMRIPDAMNWATIKDMFKQGLKLEVNANFNGVWRKLTEDPKWSGFSKGQLRIPTQPIPAGMSVEAVEAMWRQGLKLEYYRVDIPYNFKWYDGHLKGAEMLANIRIPAQPITDKLLEVPQPAISPESVEMRVRRISEAIANLARNYCADKGTAPLPKAISHAKERALWKAQREAGTNEVWQLLLGNGVADIRVDVEPKWHPDFIYRVKPMKLTARICRVGKAYPMSYSGQEWEFTGTREEYRAECEKYGYVVVSEIKEVAEKPKTVKYYFAMYKMTIGDLNTIYGLDKEWILDWTDRCGHTIIGNIEEREIEA